MLNAHQLAKAIAVLREVWNMDHLECRDMEIKFRALQAASDLEVALGAIKIPVAAHRPDALLEVAKDPSLLV